MGKKQVYNGYLEKYLTGIELKEMYKNEYLGIKRHHASIAAINIKDYLTFLNIDEEKTYRIFYNESFCRVMDGEKDTLIDFFCHNKIEEINTNFNLKEIKYNYNCPDCGEKMKYKVSKYGPFLGCSGYPKCKHTENIPIIGEYKSL